MEVCVGQHGAVESVIHSNLRINLPKLYPITDAQLSGLSHAEQVRRLCAGGATVIQLREKQMSPREFYSQAEAALRVARAGNARLIINDRADIAFALGADGVHLGQDDLPPAAARELLGPDAIIGFSTHNLEQAKESVGLPVDYVAIGPIFETSSKERPDPTLGLDALREIRRALGDLQLVAIGGIGHQNLKDVVAAGVDSVAVIRLLLSDPARIEARARQFLNELETKTP